MKVFFPKHINLTIEHNPQTINYETVAEYLESPQATPDFENEESKNRAIATNELWEMHWYPNTPVGFNKIGAPTLEELFAYAEKECASQ